jgi:hypothetical protein
MKWQRQFCSKTEQMILPNSTFLPTNCNLGDICIVCFEKFHRFLKEFEQASCGMQAASLTCLLWHIWMSGRSSVHNGARIGYLDGWSKITFVILILHCSYNFRMIMNITLKQVSIKYHTHKANYIKHQTVCEFVHQTRTSCFRLYLPQISWPSNAMSMPIMASCNQGWKKKKKYNGMQNIALV